MKPLTIPLSRLIFGEGDGQVVQQNDAVIALRFAQLFDYLKHSMAEKRAAIELRDEATRAVDGELDTLELSKDAVRLLSKICESPMDHLKEKTAVGAEGIDVKEGFLNTDTAQSAILSLEPACKAALGEEVATTEAE
jgi:hypothetical protein